MALHQLQAEMQALTMESQALKEGMLQEQFNHQKTATEATQIQADLDAKNAELRELRTSWTEREKRSFFAGPGWPPQLFLRLDRCVLLLLARG